MYGAADFMSHGPRANYLKLAWQYLRRPRIDPLGMIDKNRSVMGFNLIWLWERAEELSDRDGKLQLVRQQLTQAAEQHRTQLETIARMTQQEARDALMGQMEDEAKRAAMQQVREIEQRAREDGEERARKIVTIAIQRVASEQTSESTVSVFSLPSEDMKGRIIGREGRNIRAFEAATGVNLIIDDTPEGGQGGRRSLEAHRSPEVAGRSSRGGEGEGQGNGKGESVHDVDS